MALKRVLLFTIILIIVSSILGFGSVPTTRTGGTGVVPVTAGGTSTSTGSSSGTYDNTTIVLVNIDEKKSADSYKRNGSSVDHLTNRHVVGLDFLIHHETGTVSDPLVKHSSTTTTLYALDGTELRDGSTATAGTVTIPSHTTYNEIGAAVSSGSSHVYVQTSSTGAISGGQSIKFIVYYTFVTEYWNPLTPTVTSHGAYYYDYTLQKLSALDASIDTRKTYGQPNKDGELPADPNAPRREVNFGGWKYKGGLFVGNMPEGGKDVSGLARSQLWVQGGSTYASTYDFAALSLFDTGKPLDSGITGALDLGVYIPSSSDTNIGSTDADVTWATAWSITPGTVNTGGSSWTSSAFSGTTLSSTGTDDYVCLPLSADGGNIHPAHCLDWLCLAIQDESTFVSGSSTAWHYFASSEYETGSTFPLNDCAPRVWVVVPNTKYTETW